MPHTTIEVKLTEIGIESDHLRINQVAYPIGSMGKPAYRSMFNWSSLLNDGYLWFMLFGVGFGIFQISNGHTIRGLVILGISFPLLVGPLVAEYSWGTDSLAVTCGDTTLIISHPVRDRTKLKGLHGFLRSKS